MRWFCAILMMLASISHVHAIDPIVIATGERGGNYYSVGGAICRAVNLSDPSSCMIVPTDGSLDNMYAISLGDVSFAIVQADVQRAAQSGSDEISGSYGALRSIASVYPEMLTVITRADNPIMRLGDLKGLKVAAGSINSGSRWTFLKALRAIGMAESDLDTFVSQTDSMSSSALCAGTLDAMAVVVGHPSAVLSRLGDTCAVRVVPLSADEMRLVVETNPVYRPITVPPGIYPFVPGPVPTIGTEATVVTLATTPDEQVEAILGTIFDDIDAFRRQQFVLAPTVWPDDGRAAPLHRAARRFYQARMPVQ